MNLILREFKKNIHFQRGYDMKLELHTVNLLQGGMVSVFVNIMFLYINLCFFCGELGKVGHAVQRASCN
jgi:hypothetical protein